MLKVLIVDDNRIERESLKECIDWNSVNAELVGEANNGYTAIDLLIKHQPDILISDIRMPKMDGIELGRHAVKLCPNIKIIFLTGHEDFDAARHAVNMNAYGYIVKPVTVSDIYEVIRKTIDATVSANLTAHKEKMLKLQLAEIKPVLKEKFIRDLLLGAEKIEAARLEEKMEFYDLRLKADSFYVSVFNIDNFEATFNCLSENDKQLRLLEISNWLGNELPSEFAELFIVDTSSYRKDHHLTAIVNFNREIAPEANRLESLIDRYCQAIMQKANEICGLSLTVGISGVAKSLTELHRLYNEAATAVSYKFFRGKHNVIHVHDLEAKSDGHPFNFPRLENELVQALKVGDSSTAQSLLDEIFNSMVGEPVSMKYVQNLYMEMTYAVKRMLMELDVNIDSVQGFPGSNEKITEFETMFDIADYMRETCQTVIRHLHARRKDIQTIRVEKVIQIMKENLANNISIEEISGKVYLTQNYLRRIFKEKTGENMHEYYTKLKIEKAKELLADPGRKIHEVAKLSGYESSSYFCAIFREITRQTPNEYKESMIKLAPTL